MKVSTNLPMVGLAAGFARKSWTIEIGRNANSLAINYFRGWHAAGSRNLENQMLGLRLTDWKMINQKEVRAWQPGAECLWKKHGVWTTDDKKNASVDQSFLFF